MYELLVDRIYEAAIIPEIWSGSGVLDLLAGLARCSAGVMFATDGRQVTDWVSNPAGHAKVAAYVEGGWIARNPYVLQADRQARFAEPRFVLDTEAMSPDEMATSDYYQGYMRPWGKYWHAGTAMTSPTGDSIRLSVHRDYDEGPLDAATAAQLSLLRPHLARASLVSARLRFAQVRAAVEAFDLIGLASAAIRRGRLVTANDLFQALVPAVAQDRRDRLRFVQPAADSCWQAALGSERARGRTFQIAATADAPPRIVHVLPLAGAANDIFAAADALMVVIDVAGDTPVDAGLLLGLFDLTAAEAEVLRLLVQGRTLAAIAAARGVALGTVRSQLKAIFGKTGTHRQAELVQLVAGIRPIGRNGG